MSSIGPLGSVRAIAAGLTTDHWRDLLILMNETNDSFRPHPVIESRRNGQLD